MDQMTSRLTTSSKPWLLGRLLPAAVISVMSVFAAHEASAQRRDDSYRPPAEEPYETAPGQTGPGQFGKQGYGGEASSGSSSGGYGQNTYGQPQTYGNQSTYGQPVPPPPREQGGYNAQAYGQSAPPASERGYAANNSYNGGTYGSPRSDDSYRASPPPQDGYGAPYSSPPVYDQGPPPPSRYADDGRSPARGYYSQGEIVDKGRGFFGSITTGLASAIEYTYQKAGRPNGYILGEDGGGAFFAGLRYGEGTLYTKDVGDHKVFWQGPSLGYDIGGEGSKVMVLVYNMSDPSQIYHRFGGIEGSAYLVGGVSVQFQKDNDVTMAVIRSGVGLRLGANVGYLKYSRTPTWNPF